MVFPRMYRWEEYRLSSVQEIPGGIAIEVSPPGHGRPAQIQLRNEDALKLLESLSSINNAKEKK